MQTQLYRLALLGLLLCGPLSADDLLLKNVHIVDPAHRTVTEGDLFVQGGRIRPRNEKVPKNFKGKVMDLSGRWVIPALTDAHAHGSWGNPGPGASQNMNVEEAAKFMLYSGVTAFLDLFADEDEIFHYRERSRAKDWVGASIYAAGPMLTCTGGHGVEFGIRTRTMDNPAEARQQLRELARRKPDVVKISYDHAREYASMNEATLRAAIAEARRLHLKTVIHIGTWQDAREAVLAGATVITHLFETQIPDDLVKLMHDKGVWEIPTMTYQTEIARMLDNPAWLDSPLLTAVSTPQLLASYKTMNLTNLHLQQIILWQRKGMATYPATLKKLVAGKVRLMAGTDSGDLGVFQGYSVHREMQIFVESGVPVWDALAAGTSNPKKFLGRPGGIEPGSLADLVVLEGSPLADITNTQKIELVIHDGKIVDRQALVPQRVISGQPH